VAALLVAIYGGHKEIAKLLITKGADVNGRQGNLGVTPSNNKEIAELLITNGAHVNAKDKDGDTPLNFAIGRPQTAILLRKHGGKTGEELKAERRAQSLPFP
jgi:ankyrin repeat protein